MQQVLTDKVFILHSNKIMFLETFFFTFVFFSSGVYVFQSGSSHIRPLHDISLTYAKGNKGIFSHWLLFLVTNTCKLGNFSK